MTAPTPSSPRPDRGAATGPRTGTGTGTGTGTTAPRSCAEEVRDAVGQWYSRHARDLPWRAADRTAWGVLVSEVMLQQTPVVRVEPAWRAWVERWPTPGDLAAAPTADVLRAWGRLGYPRRALRLQDCARAIVERHGGDVPRGEDALRALPGVGEYTAAAVTAFAHGRHAVVVDTNVRRVLARAVGGTALPAPSFTAAERRLATAYAPEPDDAAVLWACASMELGALVCTARNPRCGECPLRDRCAWRLAGRPADEHAARRRTQTWAGTDRQARGRVMAALREGDGPLDRTALHALWHDAAQLDRCVASLVEDGLVETDDDGGCTLPT
ncbi:A/G-specific adenine glycosylase [Cellulosimicrobium arenosum]|uniref:Adenine DNA glycosylase n=1 Tax=Cellulosimicrobium arenosum TaxID=2708133 RepID=A0A927J042_9MICO|nr:A/G-specific adenine glycosylase [Cellulosimicrobium arenosum]MBD8079449.1 A/G-specific adenine glycosylase [Cellulosimicrobium arenosum]